VALHVRSLQTSIAFYERYTSLRVIDRHSDASSTGMEVVWLSDRPVDDESAFVLVLQEGTPRSIPVRRRSRPRPHQSLRLRLAVSRFSRRNGRSGKNAGLLQFGPPFSIPTPAISASSAIPMATT